MKSLSICVNNLVYSYSVEVIVKKTGSHIGIDVNK